MLLTLLFLLLLLLLFAATVATVVAAVAAVAVAAAVYHCYSQLVLVKVTKQKLPYDRYVIDSHLVVVDDNHHPQTKQLVIMGYD